MKLIFSEFKWENEICFLKFYIKEKKVGDLPVIFEIHRKILIDQILGDPNRLNILEKIISELVKHPSFEQDLQNIFDKENIEDREPVRIEIPPQVIEDHKKIVNEIVEKLS